MAKDFSEAFYHSAEWKATRNYILHKFGYTCQRCGAPGRTVHHKERLTAQNINDRNVTINQSNLELLCDYCHKREHDEERMNVTSQETRQRRAIKLDYKFDSEGNIIPPGEY